MAKSSVKALPPEQFKRIVGRIKALASNLRFAGCRKITGSENDWHIRVGAYRIIYEIDDAQHAVRVMRVRPHHTAYR